MEKLNFIEKTNQSINSYHAAGNSVKKISDGHHTFDALYNQRMMLVKIIAESYPRYSWKSWQHHDGTMFNSDFILGFTTPAGQYSFHFKAKYWNQFEVKKLDKAPEYDGHKPENIPRLLSLLGTK